jgi:hypothetical protein
MRSVLLAAAASIAAIVIPAAPAPAQQVSDRAFSGHHGSLPRAAASDRRGFDCGVRGGGRHDRRRDRRGDCNDGFLFGYGGEWALYNNRSWESDSYNDWWHDRPDRAFPRWVRHNRNCAPDRMWWSGEGWHC